MNPYRKSTITHTVLVRYAPDAPEEFKEFLQKKQQGNKQFLEFYTGEPDVRDKNRAHLVISGKN